MNLKSPRHMILLCSLILSPLVQAQQDVHDLRGAPEPHVQLRREHVASPFARQSSPLMTFHNGTVLHPSATYAVFWGAEWSDVTFTGDKIAGVDRFFGGFGGSRYAGTGNEYYDGHGNVTSVSVYNGHVMDASAAPLRAPKTSALVAEVCKVTANAPDPNGVYFIYTSTSAGNVNYCAYHSWGTCSNGAKVQLAYMPNIDGIAGCDPADNSSGNSPGLAALANVTAHELLEAITDPRGSAWYDSSGQENADKCAWSFPAGNGLSTLTNGSTFKLQMEWSNAAYKSSSGLANLSGQKGCIY